MVFGRELPGELLSRNLFCQMSWKYSEVVKLSSRVLSELFLLLTRNIKEKKHIFSLLLPNLFLLILPSGKDHICRFIGCGRNDRFNYVVMQLQVSVPNEAQMFACVICFITQT